MPQTVVVRYTTRPDSADENERLIRAVFTELAEQKPAGLSYTAVRLEDGISFMHVATIDGNTNPLNELASFTEFTADIGQRCSDGPVVTTGSVVGAYP